MARALLLLAVALLTLPGGFVIAKGLAAIRTRRTVVRGKTVSGTGAIAAGAILVGWGVGMLGVAALVLRMRLGH